MKTNEETILEGVNSSSTVNEETRHESGTVSRDSSSNGDIREGMAYDAQTGDDAQGDNGKYAWRQVVISGMSGIALGAAGILFSGARLPDEMTIGGVSEDNDNGDNQSAGGGSNTAVADVDPSAPISVAGSVSDTMSFSEAFASARHEVGANGAFVWHGQVYSTCYAEEWNALSADEQGSFSSNALAAVGGQPSYPAGTANPAQSVEEPLMAENSGAAGSAQDATGEISQEQETVEVRVLGVEENVMTSDGDVINVGIAEVEGHSAVFIDADADRIFDVVVIDTNDNGEVDENDEMFVSDDSELNVQNFQDTVNSASDSAVDDMYANMPDYTNDADVSSLV